MSHRGKPVERAMIFERQSEQSLKPKMQRTQDGLSSCRNGKGYLLCRCARGNVYAKAWALKEGGSLWEEVFGSLTSQFIYFVL